ncbi:MAG: PilZ domain-containing protein [Desulfobulbaceae bacterium]|nr:PilZ domain-containing protein [Desulfobulbaceae bacterium]
MPAGQPVKLSGLEDENCRVVNISFGGVGLRLHGDLQVQLGDILLVSFALDDKQQSELKRKIIVRHVGDNNYIGGEFNDNKDNVYEKTIGYYLMS